MSRPRRYAEDTRVPVSQSRTDIETLLRRHGATSFMSGQTATQALIAFRVKFVIKAPPADLAPAKFEREGRRVWRALWLCIKAKLESVQSDIETFDDAFMSHIVMPDGQTVGDHVRAKIVTSYKENKALPFFGSEPKQ
jgi:hypothetical protein